MHRMAPQNGWLPLFPILKTLKKVEDIRPT